MPSNEFKTFTYRSNSLKRTSNADPIRCSDVTVSMIDFARSNYGTEVPLDFRVTLSPMSFSTMRLTTLMNKFSKVARSSFVRRD